MKRAEPRKEYTLVEIWQPYLEEKIPRETVLFPDTTVLLLDVARYEARGGYLTPSGKGGTAEREHLSWLRELFQQRDVLIEPFTFHEVSRAYRKCGGEELLPLLAQHLITPWSSQHPWWSDFICTPAAYVQVQEWRERLTQKIITEIDAARESLPTRRKRDRLSPTDQSLILAAITESITHHESAAILTLDERLRFVTNTFKEMAQRYLESEERAYRKALREEKRSAYLAMLKQLHLSAPSPTTRTNK